MFLLLFRRLPGQKGFLSSKFLWVTLSRSVGLGRTTLSGDTKLVMFLSFGYNWLEEKNNKIRQKNNDEFDTILFFEQDGTAYLERH